MSDTTSPGVDRGFLQSLTLLCVEDDDETRDQLDRLLRRRVGRLVVARDGAEGFSRFQTESPDLVLTDIQMPRMDGLTMAGRIRTLDGRVPILVTTAFEQSDYFRRSIDVGIDKYIVKPIEFDRLEAALLECAHRLRAERDLALRGRLEADLRRQQAIALLAGGMAHDYNNLVQAILGNVGIAQRLVPAGTELEAVLREAMSAAEQTRALGRMLLLIASGGLFRPSEVPLATLLPEWIGGVIRDQPVKHDLVIADDASKEVTVTGDRRQLAVLFEQVATNAVEAMPSGGTLRTSISIVQRAADDGLPLPAGAWLRIAMRDTGSGIEPALIDRVFEPYVTTKERGTRDGTGLGLTICRSIAQKHGGLITVTSTEGQGAEFDVYLPLSPAPIR